MKYSLLLIGIFFTAVATAQLPFNFYVQGGGNYTTVRIPRTTGIEESKGGFGGQIGIGTEYQTSFGYFLYLGASLRRESYRKDSLSKYYQDTVTKFKYTPLFLDFPLGIGWQFPVNKKLSLKVYGGLNVQVGVTGKIRKDDLFYVYDSTLQQPVLSRTQSGDHDMRFGRLSHKKYSYDYANTNWEAHVGTGIVLKNSFEINVFYHYGFTNFLPNRDAAVEINKLSFLELNLKVYYPNFLLGNNQKRSDF